MKNVWTNDAMQYQNISNCLPLAVIDAIGLNRH